MKQRALIVAFLGLPSIGGLLLWAAQVGPEDAVSNLAKWAKTIGVDSPPSWLVTQSADDWATLAGVIAILAGLLAAVILWFGSGRKGKTATLAVSSPDDSAACVPPASDGPFASIRLLYEGESNKLIVIEKQNVRSLLVSESPDHMASAKQLWNNKVTYSIYATFDRKGPFLVKATSHASVYQWVESQGDDFVRLHVSRAITTKVQPGEVEFTFHPTPPTQEGHPARQRSG